MSSLGAQIILLSFCHEAAHLYLTYVKSMSRVSSSFHAIRMGDHLTNFQVYDSQKSNNFRNYLTLNGIR